MERRIRNSIFSKFSENDCVGESKRDVRNADKNVSNFCMVKRHTQHTKTAKELPGEYMQNNIVINKAYDNSISITNHKALFHKNAIDEDSHEEYISHNAEKGSESDKSQDPRNIVQDTKYGNVLNTGNVNNQNLNNNNENYYDFNNNDNVKIDNKKKINKYKDKKSRHSFREKTNSMIKH